MSDGLFDELDAAPRRQRDYSREGRRNDPLTGPTFYLGDSGPRAFDAPELADLVGEVPSGITADSYHMSPSAWATWERCPRRWWFQYMLGIREAPGVEAVLGTFVHAVMERVLECEERDGAGEWLRAVKNFVWRNELLPSEDWKRLRLSVEEARGFALNAAAAIDAYVTEQERVEGVVDGLAVSEWKIRRVLPGGARFTGRIDLTVELPDGLAIVDYKTGSLDLTSKYADEKLQEKFRQVLLYVAAVEAEIGRRPDRAVLWFPVDQGWIEAPMQDTDRVVDEFTECFETVTATIRARPAPERIEHRPGPLCAWCPAWQRCPEGSLDVLDRLEAGKLRADSPAGREISSWACEPQALFEGGWGKLQRGRGRIWRAEELRACAEECLDGFG